MRGRLGHVTAAKGRADAAALAGEGHDESRAARHADRTGEPKQRSPHAEQPNRGHLEAAAGQADAAGVRRAPWPRLRVAAKLPQVPDVATTARDVLLAAILLPLLVQWWSTYYPDAEPGVLRGAGERTYNRLYGPICHRR